LAFRPTIKRQLLIIVVVCGTFFVGGLVLLGGILSSSGPQHTPAGERFEARLKPFLAGGNVAVPMRTLADFEWSEVCFSDSYGGSALKDSLGDRVLDDMPWRMTDSLWGLVFLDAEENITTVSVASQVLRYT